MSIVTKKKILRVVNDLIRNDKKNVNKACSEWSDPIPIPSCLVKSSRLIKLNTYGRGRFSGHGEFSNPSLLILVFIFYSIKINISYNK